MSRSIRPLFSLLILFSALLGFAYPAVIAGFARLAFPSKASGSIVSAEQSAVSSILIGQTFTRPEFFWGRPSATSPVAYNSLASSASNLGPLNPKLRRMVENRIDALRCADPGNKLPIPVDLVTASASGLDPHISPEAALYQVPRISRVRNLPEKSLRRLVEEHVEGRWLGIFGEPKVNVLLLNLAIKGIEKKGEK